MDNSERQGTTIPKYFKISTKVPDLRINKYDIFDILTEKSIIVEFDSKENFDNKYQGSWFFYTR